MHKRASFTGLIGLFLMAITIISLQSCTNKPAINQIETSEKGISTSTSSEISMFTPALKRAIAMLETEGDSLAALKIILLVDENAGELEKQQLQAAGIELTQQITNKWFIRCGLSSLDTIRHYDWIKSADISQTRNMKK